MLPAGLAPLPLLGASRGGEVGAGGPLPLEGVRLVLVVPCLYMGGGGYLQGWLLSLCWEHPEGVRLELVVPCLSGSEWEESCPF